MKSICLVASIFLIALGSPVLQGAGGDYVLGSPDASAIIAAPDSVRVWRTVGSLKSATRAQGEYYQKSGEGIPLSPDLAARLSKVLTDTATYTNIGPDCEAMPGVVAEFTKGDRKLLLYFCFECDILQIVQPAEKSKSLPNAYFAHDRAKLVEVMKQIFPKDHQIQSLKDKRDG